MKRVLMIVLAFAPLLSMGQQTMTDFMEETCDVIWFGLDFTEARMVGSEGFNDPVAIKEQYFYKWNRLMLSERDKFDWAKVLQVPDMNYDNSVVDAVNDGVKVKSLVIDRSHAIGNTEVEAAINRYKITKHEDGIGIVVVVESFDKIRQLGTGYLIFFDVATKKVIYQHELIGEPAGFGFRNYWAGAVYDWVKYTQRRVMKDIRKKYG